MRYSKEKKEISSYIIDTLECYGAEDVHVYLTRISGKYEIKVKYTLHGENQFDLFGHRAQPINMLLTNIRDHYNSDYREGRFAPKNKIKIW